MPFKLEKKFNPASMKTKKKKKNRKRFVKALFQPIL
jgi:hypothetical protein